MSHDHAYTSTACHHGVHNRCRLRCKWCQVHCACTCHDAIEALIEQSSLGTPEAKAIQARTPPDVSEEIMRRLGLGRVGRRPERDDDD